MALKIFDPRRKTIEGDVETEMSLPPFRIDINGFLMFEDEELGGCGVFEVTPLAWTAAVTHHDDVRSEDGIDGDAQMTSSLGIQYGDSRHAAVVAWVRFLNSLLPLDANTSQTHVQIIAKKSRPYEWYTRADYVYQRTLRDARALGRAGDGSAFGTRAKDYLEMLRRMSDESNEASSTFDVGHVASYDTRFFMVVSYTPSSEGWWYDGRDSDYYLVEDKLDMSHPLSMFSDPKFVDKVAARISRRARRKERESSENTAYDMFPLATDMTAAMIQTRMRDIEFSCERISHELEASGEEMPFSLRRLSGKETAALVAFFPNILTPYWEKAVTQLNENIDDIYMRLDARNAILTYDPTYVNRHSQGVIRGDIRFEVGDSEADDFKERFASQGALPDEPEWDEDDDRTVFREMGIGFEDEDQAMWDEMGISSGEEGSEGAANAFKEKYSRRSVPVAYRQRNERIKRQLESGQDVPYDDGPGIDYDEDRRGLANR